MNRAWLLISLLVGSIPSEELDFFEGSMIINDVPHTISCSCGHGMGARGGTALRRPVDCSSITSTSITIEKQSSTTSMSEDQVSEYFGQPRTLRLKPIQDVSGKAQEFKCADSRWTTPDIFALGGDLGQLLLILNVMDTELRASSSGLTEDQVGDALLAWLNLGASLTYCTDRDAINALNAHSGASVDLNNVAASLQLSVVQALAEDPSMQGDTLLKCLVGNAGQYRVRKELIMALFASFFKIHWNSPTTITAIHTHSGPSQPGAIIALDQKPGCESMGIVMSPTQLLLGGKTVRALIYDSAINQRRLDMIRVLQPRLNSTFTIDEINDTATHNAQEWIETCLTTSYPNLTVFKILPN